MSDPKPEAPEDLAAQIVRALAMYWTQDYAEYMTPEAINVVRACLAGSTQLSEQKDDTATRVDGE